MFKLNLGGVVDEVRKVFPDAAFSLQSGNTRSGVYPYVVAAELNVSVRGAWVIVNLGHKWEGVPDRVMVSDILSGLVAELHKCGN